MKLFLPLLIFLWIEPNDQIATFHDFKDPSPSLHQYFKRFLNFDTINSSSGPEFCGIMTVSLTTLTTDSTHLFQTSQTRTGKSTFKPSSSCKFGKPQMICVGSPTIPMILVSLGKCVIWLSMSQKRIFSGLPQPQKHPTLYKSLAGRDLWFTKIQGLYWVFFRLLIFIFYLLTQKHIWTKIKFSCGKPKCVVHWTS